MGSTATRMATRPATATGTASNETDFPDGVREAGISRLSHSLAGPRASLVLAGGDEEQPR